MRLKTLLAAGVAAPIVAATPAFAQDAGPAARDQCDRQPRRSAGQADADQLPRPGHAPQDTQYSGDIVVTARKRARSRLQDVPVAVTAVSGDLIE